MDIGRERERGISMYYSWVSFQFGLTITNGE